MAAGTRKHKFIDAGSGLDRRIFVDLDTDQDMDAGNRDDRLRRVDGGWQVAARTVLDANVMLSKNSGLFF